MSDRSSFEINHGRAEEGGSVGRTLCPVEDLVSRRNSGSSRTSCPLLWIHTGQVTRYMSTHCDLRAGVPPLVSLRLGGFCIPSLWIEGDTCTIPLDHRDVIYLGVRLSHVATCGVLSIIESMTSGV